MRLPRLRLNPVDFTRQQGRLEFAGAPGEVAIDPKGLDSEMARLLWERSEQVGGREVAERT